MGLPRSRLLKSKPSSGATVASTAPPWSEAFAAPSQDITAQDITARDITAKDITGQDVTRRDAFGVPSVARDAHPSGISASELVERAAALGPGRLSWESIVLSADPILDEKRQPRVAERRERFTRVVKLSLGACLAVCVVALVIHALSGSSSESARSTSASPAAVVMSMPSKGIVPIEALALTNHAKSVRRPAPNVATATIGGAKRR